jgi:hypothetical protein
MTIRCHLKSSRCSTRAFYVLHAFVLGVVWLARLPFSVALALSISILVSLYLCLSPRAKLLKRQSWDEFSYAKKQVTFFRGDEIQYDGVVLPQTVVTPYFILLSLKSESSRATYHRLICRDELRADEFRQLCVLLRLS